MLLVIGLRELAAQARRYLMKRTLEPLTNGLPEVPSNTAAATPDHAMKATRGRGDRFGYESTAGADNESGNPSDGPIEEIVVLAASSLDDETLAHLNTYIDYSVEHFFSDPFPEQDNLYPIIVPQYDRNNIESIYDLEDDIAP